MHLVQPRHHISLQDYENVATLSVTVRDLRQEVSNLIPTLGNRRVWMVNSTARGGGVAEMMPPLITLMRDLGVEANWLVMDVADPAFFRLTKRIHNMIHGEGDTHVDDADRQLYDQISQHTADALEQYVSPGDVLVIHDPQPMGAGAIVRRRMDVAAIWRCHIGLDQETPHTRAAWEFLGRYTDDYDHAIFSAPEYIPGPLTGKSTVIYPTIDPLSHKNRELPIHKLVGVLVNGSLIQPFGPVPTEQFPEPARRLQSDGTWALACQPEDIGLLFRPIITQVSRWDRLKGFLPLMEGFVTLKQDLTNGTVLESRYHKTLRLARLVLAGPDPDSIQDDPEGQEVLKEICQAYLNLPPAFQKDIAIISLPMGSAKHNALLVNALQRCSDIVVQNSLREGFGLTVTEAMWKRVAVMGSHAVGIRQQIRPGLDGCLVKDPEDPKEIASILGELLRDHHKREELGNNAQRRVYNDFLIFTQVRRLFEVITEVVEARWS